jgi:hypothetical protein
VKRLTVKVGDRLTFKGVMWVEPNWEFDAPCVIYSPLLRIYNKGSICIETIQECIEDICIDLSIGGSLPIEIACDLRELKWRKWSRRGLPRRKQAIHYSEIVQFYTDRHGVPDFKAVNPAQRESK